VDINYIHILCMYRELLMPHVLQIIDAPHTGYGICQIVQIDGCEAHWKFGIGSHGVGQASGGYLFASNCGNRLFSCWSAQREFVREYQGQKNAKLLGNGVEEAGVLCKGVDWLAMEKLAHYFMQTFKNKQLGKKGGNIKEMLGTNLQMLTENNSFCFPSTFTFVFRAFVSIEGIGKELDPDFNLGKLAQPFVEKFTEDQKGYVSEAAKTFDIFKRVTGLNTKDINMAVMQPKKIAYIEETMHAMEMGSLKICVCSLEIKKALEWLGLRQGLVENMLMASLCNSNNAAVEVKYI